jgi:predicted RNase H-like HicB family nuclease
MISPEDVDYVVIECDECEWYAVGKSYERAKRMMSYHDEFHMPERVSA